MVFSRDQIISELKASVVDLLLNAGGENDPDVSVWASLANDRLPKTFLSKEFQDGLNTFHRDNPGVFMCWDVRKKGWIKVEAGMVLDMQAKDNF